MICCRRWLRKRNRLVTITPILTFPRRGGRDKSITPRPSLSSFDRLRMSGMGEGVSHANLLGVAFDVKLEWVLAFIGSNVEIAISD